MRCRALHERATQAAGEAHALAVDVGAGRLPELQGLGILPEDQADLLEDRLGVVLDEAQPLLRQRLEARQCASDVRHGEGGARRTGGSLGIPPTRARPPFGSRLRFVHCGHESVRGQPPSSMATVPVGG